jgi:hypothetical protein
MKLLVRRALAFLAWSPLVVAAGCGNQGEGERCDTRNFEGDCDFGLFCKDDVYIDGRYHSICCPIQGTASAAACNASGGPPPLDGGMDGRSDTANDGNGGANDARTDNEGGGDRAADIAPDRAPDNVNDAARDNGREASVDAPNGNDGSDAVSTPDQTTIDAADEASIDAADEASIDAPEIDVSSEPPIDVTPDIVPDVATPDTSSDAGDAPNSDSSADTAG